MRDLILLLALLCTVPLVVRAPVVGLLIWMWIALMNPQREVYSFLAGAELNFMVAALTALAWFASKERKTPPINMVTVLLCVLAVWACITTYWALDRAHSAPLLDRFLKTVVLCIAVAALTTNRARLQAVVWVIALSLGYYAVKGGGFVILTGGANRVYGPESSMIADNNTLGLALVLLLPLLNYLRLTSRQRLTRLVLLTTTAFTVLAIVGTYSRGALLALAAAALVYVIKTRASVTSVVLIVLALGAAPSLVPTTWLDRMSTLQSYEEDASFEGRVAAWKTSVNIAAQRPVGGGFSAVVNDWVVQAYQSPGSLTGGKAAHSLYFEVLGDHGFFGLALYVAMLAAAWFNTSLVLIAARGRHDLEWAAQFARMLQVGLAAYLVGGAGLSMSYYDGFLIVLVLTAALLHIVRQPSQEAGDAATPNWRRAAVRTA